jgi:hypothetical protein
MRASSIPEAFVPDREAAAYWIARSSLIEPGDGTVV